MRSGGFDVVIGNPPYGVEHSPSEVNYLKGQHPEAEQFPDSYCLFMIKALHLTRTGGFVSLIVPNTFCDLENCQLFRKWLLEHNTLEHIWQTGWAFKAAVVDTLVFVATNQQSRPQIPASLSSLVSDSTNAERKSFWRTTYLRSTIGTPRQWRNSCRKSSRVSLHSAKLQ